MGQLYVLKKPDLKPGTLRGHKGRIDEIQISLEFRNSNVHLKELKLRTKVT